MTPVHSALVYNNRPRFTSGEGPHDLVRQEMGRVGERGGVDYLPGIAWSRTDRKGEVSQVGTFDAQ